MTPTLMVLAAMALILAFLAGRARVSRPSAPPSVHLGPEGEREVRELAAGGRQIEAIKRVRALTGIGLKEAKDLVDALPDLPQGVLSKGEPASARPSDDAEVRALVAKGNLIEAIKLVRATTGMGLKEAKDYVDSLASGGGNR